MNKLIKIRKKRKQKVNGGVIKQKFHRNNHKEHVMSLKENDWYVNEEID